MAKKSVIARERKRKILSERFRKERKELKRIIKKCEDGREEAIDKLDKRRRDESPSRGRNRCRITGRPRGNLRKFGLSRIQLREAMMRGDVPGLKKASW
jgi:small subunit ribosomal protein S14